MAFCTRSERKINLYEKENFPVGPGQYIKLPHKKVVQNRELIPFNTSYPKIKQKQEVTPGPGSYNLLHSMNNSNSTLDISKSSNSIQSTVDQSVLNQKGKNGERLGFMTKVERFQPVNDVYKNPGPGAYNVKNKDCDSCTNIKIATRYGNQKHFVQLQTGSLNRIVSIPSKKMNGYYLDMKNEKSEMIVDPLSIENYTGATSSLVGPGSYELARTKKNNAIDWERTTYKKEKQIKKEKEFERKIIQDIHPDDKKLELNNIRVKNNYRAIISQRNDSSMIFRKFPSIYNEIGLEGTGLQMDDVPGPGYYEREFNYGEKKKEKEKENPLKKVKHHQEDFNFGSKSTRFMHKSISSENIGPTTYFIQKNKFEPNRKINFFSRLKSRSLISHKEIDPHVISLQKEIIAGPGSYDLSRGFLKEQISKKGILDSKDPRFKEPSQVNTIPGPGSYLSQNIISSKSQTNINHFSKKEEEITNYTEKKTLSKQNSITPGAGAYHPEIVNSIEYKNTIRSNPIQGMKCSFLVSSNRFNYKTDNMVGPGDYSPKDLDKMGKSFTSKAVFNTNEKRFGLRYKNNIDVGPGDYNLNKNEWNKRTYNVLFFKK